MVLETSREISAFISSIAYVSVPLLEIELLYRDERGNVTDRSVEPIKYFQARDGREFLRAWCTLRRDERTFRVDRILQIKVTKVSPEPKPDSGNRAPAAHKPQGTTLKSCEIRQAQRPSSRPAAVKYAKTTTQLTSSQRPPQKPKRHYYLLKAACAAGIILLVRGYFHEDESGSYSTPPKIHSFMAKTRVSRTARTTPVVASTPVVQAVASRPSSSMPPPPLAKTAYETALETKAALFQKTTGVDDEDLIARYTSADADRNGKLSWEEIGTFQRALYRRFAYEPNQTALRPDEFLAAGGGDCEDWSLVTAGLLRFWGYGAYIGSIRSPDNLQGHAVCLVKTPDKPQNFLYYRFKESGMFNGTFVEEGYYVPIDYQLVGSLTSAAGSNWRLKRMYVPEKIYGATM